MLSVSAAGAAPTTAPAFMAGTAGTIVFESASVIF